ncbi:MAG: hypothetical protein CMO45_07895 [Verrucomicrobiales bacterium]|nr:hypothetical protein [Verrucomicrobiales bacterium]
MPVRQDSEMTPYSIKLLILLSLLALSADSFSQQLVAPKERPNVLLLVADDMNWDSPGCFGGAAPNITPNIDRLASEGIRFKCLCQYIYMHSIEKCNADRALSTKQWSQSISENFAEYSNIAKHPQR